MRRRHALAIWPGLWVLPRKVAAAAPPVCTADGGASTDVWVELSLPPAGRQEHRTPHERILEQQARVMSQLHQLGAIELGRVQLLRNALAVRLPCAQLDAARRLPGVRRLRPVRDVPRPPPASKG
jgi:hypothetical protein